MSREEFLADTRTQQAVILNLYRRCLHRARAAQAPRQQPHRRLKGSLMSSNEQALLDKLKALPPQQRAEVEDFVDFLTAKARKRAAIDRLLAIAPALEAAGVEPMSDEEINAEIKAARAERRARRQQEPK
jgi:hypothetical protein